MESDSEEATALGLGWKPLVVKETQYPEVEPVCIDKGYVSFDSITENGDEYEARMDREQLADTKNGCKLTLKISCPARCYVPRNSKKYQFGDV